ncbi:amidohydrolase family protein [Larkinella humicola]|uniref:Amidohydrolase family protein n=1 Tax=Larkinella humicola TaxID=2607654 RepID=A0A5N1JNC0_9BACT|nr:amidohydrolase family protein [Larkinella humicola]KAA9357328.1 amidohydrolase family protein [Larkinella humicola]
MRCLFSFLFLFFFTTSQAQKTKQFLFIKAGKLYDSEKNVFLVNQDLIIEGDRIVAVGSGLKKPKKARLIDLRNSTVTPGLIDAHTHLLINQKITKDGLEVASKVPADERMKQALGFAKSNLLAGVTTVRDVGNSGQFLDVRLKEELRHEENPGPHMVVSGPILSPPGGQFGRLFPADSFLINQEYRVIKGAEDARAAVLEHIRRGVDVIKVCMNTDNRVLAPDEIKAIVETAHQQKIPVTAHATYDESARDAVLAGVDGIEHGYSLSDSTLSIMAKRGTYLVPTDVSREQGKLRVAAVGMKGKEGEDYLNGALKGFHDRLNRAVKKGVPIVSGSDYYNDIPGIERGKGSVDVLLSYAEAGIPVPTVLQFATLNAARALGLSGQTGTLKKGMKADLAVFKGDLEKDFPTALFAIEMVIKDGKVYP